MKKIGLWTRRKRLRLRSTTAVCLLLMLLFGAGDQVDGSEAVEAPHPIRDFEALLDSDLVVRGTLREATREVAPANQVYARILPEGSYVALCTYLIEVDEVMRGTCNDSLLVVAEYGEADWAYYSQAKGHEAIASLLYNSTYNGGMYVLAGLSGFFVKQDSEWSGMSDMDEYGQDRTRLGSVRHIAERH